MSMYMSMSMSRTINTALCLKSVFLVAPLAVKRSSLCFGYVSWCQCFYFEKFIGDLNLVFLYDSVSCYLCK